jgi:hypothetical protein
MDWTLFLFVWSLGFGSICCIRLLRPPSESPLHRAFLSRAYIHSDIHYVAKQCAGNDTPPLITPISMWVFGLYFDDLFIAL